MNKYHTCMNRLSKNKIYEYIGVIIILMYSTNVTNSVFRVKYYEWIPFTVDVIVVMFFFWQQLKKKKNLFSIMRSFRDLIEQYFLPFFIPTLIATVTAAVIYCNNRFTKSSYKYVLWLYGAYLLGYILVRRYKKKALYLELIAGIVSYLSVIVRVIVEHDLGLLEVHELTYIFGIFLLFFCFYKQISPTLRIGLCVVCFIGVALGNKRALWLALVVAFCTYLVCYVLLHWKRKGLLSVGVCGILLTFGWFFVIKYGYFELFCQKMSIPDNSRLVMWKYFSDYFELNPLYLGRGLTYTLVEADRLQELFGLTKAISIHNTMLSMYIGWGFIPFLYYMCVYMIGRIRYIYNKGNERNAWIFMSVTLMFLIINYLGSTMFNMGISIVYISLWTFFRDEGEERSNPSVGILSMQRIVNYGSFMQALGLKLMINELGYDTSFVDFSIGKSFSKENMKNMPLYRTVRRLLAYLKPLPDQRMSDAIASQFDILGLSNRYHYRSKVDILVLGSDEVFNFIQNEEKVGCSPELLGVNNKAKKVISYAASCGNLTEKRMVAYGKEDVFAESMKKLSGISVRDYKTFDLVKKYTGRSPFMHLDPVLVADFGNLLTDSVTESNYILVYGYSGRFTKEEGAAIREYAQKHNKKLYTLSEVHPFCDEVIYCKPLEVIAYFQHADLVITDTFHGTVFSLVAEKNFAVIVRDGENGNENKLICLLKQFDIMSKRIYSVDKLEAVLENPVDYENVKLIRQKERKRAFDYLRIQLCESDKKECCGCGACVQSCPTGAVSMEEDEYGFTYPHTDSEKCILCGRCVDVCNYKKKEQSICKEPLRAYAAVCKADELLMQSSSGGVFAVLARHFVMRKGVVYGCAFDYEADRVVAKHIRVDKIQDISRLAGSKYVQSEMGNCYSLVKEDLDKGYPVMFSGTPCQVDGLRGYLGRDYTNLFMVDLICHGVPGRKLFDGYIDFLSKKHGGRIIDFRFRSKKKGWGHTGEYRCQTDNGDIQTFELKGSDSSYYRMFLNGDTFRENCYSCPYAQTGRCGDITLGDYWGAEEEHPELGIICGEKGLSCVLINTEKAMALISELSEKLDLYPSDLQKIKSHNGQLNAPCLRGDHRREILQLFKAHGYRGVEKYQQTSMLKEKVKSGIKHFVGR